MSDEPPFPLQDRSLMRGRRPHPLVMHRPRVDPPEEVQLAGSCPPTSMLWALPWSSGLGLNGESGESGARRGSASSQKGRK